MPKNITKNWLLCYDIADPKRLGRVHRYVKTVAIPLQYSVYQLTADERQLQFIINSLNEIISQQEDDIRIYPMHNKPRKYTIGKTLFPQGLMLINNENDLLK